MIGLPLTGGCNCGAIRFGERWFCGDCGSSLFGRTLPRHLESRHAVT